MLADQRCANGLGCPAPDIIHGLEESVRRRLGGRLLDLRLVVRAEGFVLRGRSRTYYAKQLAQHAIMEASAFPILANEIEVS